MNSQIVSIDQALKSHQSFYLVASVIAVALFFSAGFVSVSIIWFFSLCIYNFTFSSGWSRKRLIPFVLPILLFMANIPWIFFSSDQPATAGLIMRKVHLFLIPLGYILVNKNISDRAINVIFNLFFVGCIVASLVCLGSASINFLQNEGSTDAFSHFTYTRLTDAVNIQPVYLSMFLNMAFLITLQSPFFSARAKLWIGLYLAVFVVLIASGVGIVCLVVIFLISLQATIHKRIGRGLLASFLLIACIVSVIQFRSMENEKVDLSEMNGDMVNSMPARLAIWSFAVLTAKGEPWTGYGSGLGQAALDETYKSEKFTWGVRESLNPHNQFLSTYLDLGVLGTGILATMLVYAFVFGVRTNDIVLISFVAITFSFFMFESILVRQKGIVFFSFFYCLIFSNRITDRSIAPTSPENSD